MKHKGRQNRRHPTEIPNVSDDPNVDYALWLLSLVLKEVADGVDRNDGEQTKADKPSSKEAKESE